MKKTSRDQDLSAITKVVSYYSEKILSFGPTHKGVDWSSTESQELRFQKLSELFNRAELSRPISILDYGCGYGAFFQYLTKTFPQIQFLGTGYDLSKEMLTEAIKLNQSARWIDFIPDGTLFDYVVASGVFNVKLDTPEKEWKEYLLSSIEKINALSGKGFALNLLTAYSDKHKMASHLYYADPSEIFRFCRENFSKYVSVLHDYPLYEFTILVRKTL